MHSSLLCSVRSVAGSKHIRTNARIFHSVKQFFVTEIVPHSRAKTVSLDPNLRLLLWNHSEMEILENVRRKVSL